LKPFESIIKQLPYTAPFLFVDALTEVTENGAIGSYTFQPDEFYYEGHFKDHPVTPGVILTECMAQIGLVCLGIYLLKDISTSNLQIALSSNAVDFYKPVFPGERVTVTSEKEYFRFHKLKCKATMRNEKDEVVAKGTISGMMKGS